MKKTILLLIGLMMLSFHQTGSARPPHGRYVRLTIPNGDIGSNPGLAFYYYLPNWVRCKADSRTDMTASNANFLEDGYVMGPAHSLHLDIQQKGEGRFSHWQPQPKDGEQAYVTFSSSDGTDPRKNGRVYEFQCRLH